MNMDATKKLLKNIPEYLLYFLAADLVCMLAAWVVNIVVRPILTELARGDASVLATIDFGMNIFFAALFYVVLGVILAKSPIQRTAYLSATIGKDYHFGADLAEFVKHGLFIGVVAYLIFCLPVTALVWLVPDVLYIPTLFYAQDAMISLLGAWTALAADLAIYLVFALIIFPCLHLYWEKNRLYK